MHTYTAEQQADKSWQIKRDDTPLSCPKTAVVVPQQSNVSGQVQMLPIKFPCSTNCPFASIVDKNSPGCSHLEDKKAYKINCEAAFLLLSLDEMNEFKKEPPKKPLHIIGQA